MGIDGIGKKGGPTPAPDVGAKGAPGTVDKAFHVDKSAPANEVRAIDPTSPLARLRAGEIDLDGYIDAKVEERTKHIQGISGDELDFIKSTLRDQMRSDPALVDLVRAVTGRTPKPREDEE